VNSSIIIQDIMQNKRVPFYWNLYSTHFTTSLFHHH